MGLSLTSLGGECDLYPHFTHKETEAWVKSCAPADTAGKDQSWDLKLVLFEPRTRLPKHSLLIPNYISPNTKSRPFGRHVFCSFQCLDLCSRNTQDLLELALEGRLSCSTHPELSLVPTPWQLGRYVGAQIAWTPRLEAKVSLYHGSKFNPANGGSAKTQKGTHCQE